MVFITIYIYFIAIFLIVKELKNITIFNIKGNLNKEVKDLVKDIYKWVKKS